MLDFSKKKKKKKMSILISKNCLLQSLHKIWLWRNLRVPAKHITVIHSFGDHVHHA